jgi:glycosyltransferase involved in cell wall biosynthesis
MLTPWALRYRGWKKKLAWWLYQRRDLRSAKVLHATSPAEAESFRAVGLTQPVAVVPNGVETPGERWAGASVGGGSVKAARTVLFLGRIHPIKGLMDLVKAWALIKQGKAESRNQKAEIGWRVVIAGGDEGGHLEEVKAETRKQKVEGDFQFVGPVDGPAKWDLYRSADLFVLPSKSENFGIVVAEALACGVPVITTRGTPWEELETHHCGWWVELGVEPLARALREAIAVSDVERREMGRRGRELVEERYTWPAAAQKMVAVYRWMLGEGERPECVSVGR